MQPSARDGRAGREPEDPPRIGGFAGAPAYGVLSSIARDNVYWFGTRGFVFTSPWVVTSSTVRHSGVLLLTATGEPFDLWVNGRILRHDAVAIAPQIRRGLRAVDVALISVHVEVKHSGFRWFRGIGHPGVLTLDRERFACFEADLIRAYEGRLTHREAERAFDGLVETATALLPDPQQPDPRAAILQELLSQDPACSLGDVARKLNVSYTSASHIFARVMGMPLRSYQHWLKCMRAEKRLRADMCLTEVALEAGFADSSHLARTWQRSYGLSPSYIRDSAHVRIIS